VTIPVTLRQATRNSSETAEREVWVTSHPAWSSKSLVNREPCLAHGTAATVTP
jgi:hypothetical protein